MAKREIFKFDQNDFETHFPSEALGKIVNEGGACYGLSMYWMRWFASAWGQGVNLPKLLMTQKYERDIAAGYMVKYQNNLLDELMAKKAYPITSTLQKPKKPPYDPIANTSIFGQINHYKAYEERQKKLNEWGAQIETPLALKLKDQIIKFI